MVDINEVADKIYLIDDHLYSIPKFGSVYLLNNEEREALIYCGPTTSADYVLDGIKKLIKLTTWRQGEGNQRENRK